MPNDISSLELQELISANDVEAIRNLCEKTHPANIVELCETLENHEIWSVLRMLEVSIRADIFSNFTLDKQIELVTGEDKKNVASVIEAMAPDISADLIIELDEELREEILPLIARAERENIRKLASYSEETAGAIMNTDYAILDPDIDTLEAIRRLRLQATVKETIYYVYVVDGTRKLLGFVSLKDLIMARSGQIVRDIMYTDVITANINDDQEAVVRLIEKYDLIAIPIIDNQENIVGIVTHDDALDIIRQEQTEDIEKLMAITGTHRATSYIKVSSWQHFKNRFGWIILLGVFSFISGSIIHRFEGLLAQFAILATFIPMIADTGGNTGSQSATLVIRALALEQISGKDILRVLYKEFKVAIPLALLMVVMVLGRLLLFTNTSNISADFPIYTISLAVAMALGLQVITSTLIGAALPLVVAAFKFDPAVVASPAVTTIVDITGLLIYFTTVQLILQL